MSPIPKLNLMRLLKHLGLVIVFQRLKYFQQNKLTLLIGYELIKINQYIGYNLLFEQKSIEKIDIICTINEQNKMVKIR